MTPIRSSSRRLALALSGGIALAGLSGGAALAQSQPAAERLIPYAGQGGGWAGDRSQAGPQLTPVQQKQIFPSWRTLALQSVQGRIGILQSQQRCIAATTDLEGLKGCMRQERQAMQAQRQQHREAMVQLFQSNGLPVPQRLQRPLRPLEPSQGAPGPNL